MYIRNRETNLESPHIVLYTKQTEKVSPCYKSNGVSIAGAGGAEPPTLGISSHLLPVV